MDSELNASSGAGLVVRRLWIADHAALVDHFLGLDLETRHVRFGRGVGDDFLLSYASGLHQPQNIVYGVFDHESLCAVGELRPVEAGSAEAAFTVSDGDRHRGLGSLLMDRMLTSAQNRGIGRVILLCVKHNEPMRHLAQKFGAELTISHGEAVGEIEPAQATPVSIFEEVCHETTGFVQTLLGWPMAFAPAMRQRL